MRTLIIGSDKEYCFAIKDFLEQRGLIVTVVLSYKEGIDKLSYETPDLTVIELTAHALSPTLMNKIKGSGYLQPAYIAESTEIEKGKKPVFILEQPDQLNTLFDLIESYLASSTDEGPGSYVDGEEESGELEPNSYPLLLSKLYQDKRNGILSINSNVILRVYLIKGVPIFAEGGEVETALGRMLLEEGKIKEDDYEKALEAANEKKLRLGEILVSMNLLSPHELNSFLELQVREKIIGGFNCVRGTYSFKPESSFADKMVAYQIDLPQLLYDGIKRRIEVKSIEEIFFKGDENPSVEPSPNLKSQIDRLGFGPRELRFIQLLKDRESMREILKMSRLPKDETIKLLYFLYLLGMVKVSGVPPPEVKKTVIRRVTKEKAADSKNEEIKIYPEDLIVLEDEVDESEPFMEGSFTEPGVEGGVHKLTPEQQIYGVTTEETPIGAPSIDKEMNDQTASMEFNQKSRAKLDSGKSMAGGLEEGVKIAGEETGKHIVSNRKGVHIPDIEIDWEKRKSVEIEFTPSSEGMSEATGGYEARDNVSEKLLLEEKKRKKEALIEEIQSLHSNLEGKSYYEILGINKSARKEEIKNAYFNLVKKFHPDANPDLNKDIRERTEEIFTKITVAYETLYDDAKRKEYDSRDEVEKVKSQVKLLYDAEIAYKAGEAFLNQRRYREAQEKFLEAVNLNPEEAAYLGALVWARFLGEIDKDRILNDVKKQLEKAIGINPKVAENHYYLGSLYKHMEDLNRAEASFLRAVECNPNYIEAKRELRLLQQRKSDSNIRDKKREKKFWSSLFKK
ncbi:MAG TPA: DnaJ domain-containing protein [Thermodesulfobacteriota bacterium]|nr:DnaJ domain-containing protein [Thermodesulfobacteriota bacterium]